MKRFIAAGIIVATLLPAASEAAAPAAGEAEKNVANPKLRRVEEKRAWLRKQVVKGLRNSRQVRHAQAQVDAMTPQQIEVLANALLSQQFPPNEQQALQQAQMELQRARWLRQMLERELWARRYGYGNGVGYMPVITWLPQGTTMGARAVVSGDRRYVRVSPQPFFSNIGPVYTYNLNTGETRLQPPYRDPAYGSPQNYGYPQYASGYRHGQMPPQHLPPRTQYTPPRVRYDGMRTRTD
jgi:hypothetical protein